MAHTTGRVGGAGGGWLAHTPAHAQSQSVGGDGGGGAEGEEAEGDAGGALQALVVRLLLLLGSCWAECSPAALRTTPEMEMVQVCGAWPCFTCSVLLLPMLGWGGA